ncbi:hypothetical protein [Aeromonas caviae]|uniref:hypothetical protein n=1 Tax=Aeromonas caviae TaxID=648 RepID=UPI002B494CB1|nr:hypothetical protein [Aeromonas caviae]
MLKPILVQLREALAELPYFTHIDNQHDYESALALIDELVDDYVRYPDFHRQSRLLR